MEGKLKKLYLQVTDDKYELPLIVADSQEELALICGVSQEELALICGVSRNTIASSLRRQRNGECRRSPFRAVEIDGKE